MKKIKLFLFIISLYPGVLFSKPQNIIFMVVDGMGVNTMTFGDMIYDISELKKFSNYGFSRTASKESKYTITDSAAAGTAMACGEKTYKKMISMDKDRKKLKSIAYYAKDNGKLVGIITNTRITHATPAVFYANNINRDNESEIARQIIPSNFDLFMGGGYQYISDIENDIKNSKYELIRKKDDLYKTESAKIIAIFSDSHMNYEIDRKGNEPSLSEMTDFGLKFLNKDKKGFFMALESGRIDQCEHSNDAPCLCDEMKELKKTLNVIFDFLSKNRDTLFILMADHSVGGLSLGRDGNEILNLDVLTNVKQSSETFLKNLKKDVSYDEFAKSYYDAYGINISETDYNNIIRDKNMLLEPLNRIANIKWSTDEHEGSYVPVFSTGPQSEMFNGIMDVDEIGKKLFKII